MTKVSISDGGLQHEVEHDINTILVNLPELSFAELICRCLLFVVTLKGKFYKNCVFIFDCPLPHSQLYMNNIR